MVGALRGLLEDGSYVVAAVPSLCSSSEEEPPEDGDREREREREGVGERDLERGLAYIITIIRVCSEPYQWKRTAFVRLPDPRRS